MDCIALPFSKKDDQLLVERCKCNEIATTKINKFKGVSGNLFICPKRNCSVISVIVRFINSVCY